MFDHQLTTREPATVSGQTSPAAVRRTISATIGDPSQRRHWGGPVVGGFYLSMGGVHLGMVSADTEIYRHFADAGLFAFVRDGWQEVFMAHPGIFGLLLMAGETAVGVLLLRGGKAATVGWGAAVVFHLLLMLFGFGIWVWCLPAIALLVHLARRDTTSRWGHATSQHTDAHSPAPGETS